MQLRKWIAEIVLNIEIDIESRRCGTRSESALITAGDPIIILPSLE